MAFLALVGGAIGLALVLGFGVLLGYLLVLLEQDVDRILGVIAVVLCLSVLYWGIRSARMSHRRARGREDRFDAAVRWCLWHAAFGASVITIVLMVVDPWWAQLLIGYAAVIVPLDPRGANPVAALLGFNRPHR